MAASKQIIAVDVDDVLAASAAAFVAFSNQRWGTKLTVQDYQEHWGEAWQVDLDETKRRAEEIHAAGRFIDYAHDDTALPVLKHLAKKYDLVVVTSRRTSIMQETLDWIELHYAGVFTDVHFSGIYDADLHFGMLNHTKAEVLQKLGASYLVDDQLKHCVAAAEAGLHAILFGDYPWNQANTLPTGVVRCPDWQAVGAYFELRA